MSLKKLVEGYKNSKKSNYDWKLSDFSKRKYENIDQLIEHAVYTHTPQLKQMHNNYYPQSREKLILSLRQNKELLHNLNTFKEIIIWIYENKPKGIADLGVYDTALCLGLHKGIKPDHVYLGVGSKEGAKFLFGKEKFEQVSHSLNGIITYIQKEDFPNEFLELDTHHIENFLCNYRNNLYVKNV